MEALDRENELARLLEESLERIKSGEETPDSAAARYPEYAGELRAMLETAQWLTEKRDLIFPSPGWVESSRRNLIAAAQGGRKTELARTRVNRRGLPVLRRAAAALLLGAVLISGTAVLAGNALPGGRLYTVKQQIEQVRLELSADGVDRAETLEVQTAERLEELERLAANGESAEIPEVAKRYEKSVGDVITEASGVVSGEANTPEELAATATFLAAYAEQLGQNTVRLTALLEKVPEGAMTAIQHAIEVSATHRETALALEALAKSGATPAGSPFVTLPAQATHTVTPGARATAAEETRTARTPGARATAAEETRAVRTPGPKEDSPGAEPTRKPTNTPRARPTEKPTKTEKPGPAGIPTPRATNPNRPTSGP